MCRGNLKNKNQTIAGYSLNGVLNADETGILYRFVTSDVLHAGDDLYKGSKQIGDPYMLL